MEKLSYIRDNRKLIFSIAPMMENSDLIFIPCKTYWKVIEDIFNYDEREEIIVLLGKVKWNRDIKIRKKVWYRNRQ